MGVTPTGAVSTADLGGSSKHSNEILSQMIFYFLKNIYYVMCDIIFSGYLFIKNKINNNNFFLLTLKAEVEQGSTGQFSTPWVTQHPKP